MSNNTVLKPTILVFADLCRLWAFSRNLTNQNQEINAATRQLTCVCSEADLERAVTHYGATQFYENTVQEDFRHNKNNDTIAAAAN